MSIFIEKYFIFIFPILFIGVWSFVIGVIRKKSKMKKGDIEQALGPILYDSGWGSADINGVNARNCAKVVEYKNGFVIMLMNIFGGGKLWVPRDRYTITESKPKRFLIYPQFKVIEWQGNKVKLIGKLSDKFT